MSEKPDEPQVMYCRCNGSRVEARMFTLSILFWPSVMIDNARALIVLMHSDGEHSFISRLGKHRMQMSSLSRWTAKLHVRQCPTAHSETRESLKHVHIITVTRS